MKNRKFGGVAKNQDWGAIYKSMSKRVKRGGMKKCPEKISGKTRQKGR